jgi:alpha-L-rhamnosidase
VAFDLASASNYPQLREFLISKGMACSPIKVLHFFDALYTMNAEDYALELMTSESERSYMNMIRFGSTGIAEAWDIKYKRNMAYIQPGGATPIHIISRKICGIEPLEPSFQKIKIKPQPGDLAWAEIKHPTIRGSIEMRFENKNDIFMMEVTLPANTRSDIYLPVKFDHYNLFCNGKETKGAKMDNCVLIENVSPGKYFFEVRKN